MRFVDEFRDGNLDIKLQHDGHWHEQRRALGQRAADEPLHRGELRRVVLDDVARQDVGVERQRHQ